LQIETPSYKILDLPIPIPGNEGCTHIFLVKSIKNALIDTGPASSLPLLLPKLEELGVNPRNIDYILGTHIHLDHLGGLSQALDHMPQAQVIVHPRGIPHLKQPERLWQASLEMSGQIANEYGRPLPVSAEKLTIAEEGSIIDLGGIQLEVLFTPGHAVHHLSFVDRQNGNLFAGEAAGVYFPDNGVNRPACPTPFDFGLTLSSLDKLIATRPEILFYCHYGSARPGLAILQASRRQLLLWYAVVSDYFSSHKQLDENLITAVVDEIITRDGTKAQFSQFSPQHLKSELYYLRNNVRGFWQYFQRHHNGPK
jgi:glyoxylase-like metal-dependent hydrolase (beta-lactamase superfamily II)